MPAGRAPRRSRLRRAALLGAAFLVALLIAAGALWATLPDPAPLARQSPRTTALIEQRRAEAGAKHRAFHPHQTFVPIERVSRRLLEAVVLSEDGNFYGHEGIDWDAMQDAARHDLEHRSFARGASTITQQLAKNLWFGTEKSLWRKAKEALLALKLERALSKRRILALYVNVVEWDDGVFGIEAGARARFGTGAASLTTAQAVVLASILPAPRRVDLASPSTWLRRRSRRLLDRMRTAGRISPEEHLHASAELERILAGPAPLDDGEEPPEDDAAGAELPVAAAPGRAARNAPREALAGTAAPTPAEPVPAPEDPDSPASEGASRP
jgi:monofunctional biosynthetic peptidoglycan transglycosylase